MKSINFTFPEESKETQYKAYADDDGISKPTKEQYENSVKLKNDISGWIHKSKKRQDELLDALFEERQAEKNYRGLYEAHRDLVRRYEIYEEVSRV